jgi:nucleotide-binding universal stress UspA family protein
MYSRIIVGFDDSEGGKDAVALGRRLADRTGAELVIAGALPDLSARRLGHAPAGGFDRDADQRFANAVARAAVEADARSQLVSRGHVAQGLLDLAEAEHADLIVVGCSKAVPGRVRAGRIATQLLHGSPAAVALAPVGYCDADPALRVIGVAIDGSPESREALHAAVEIADGATLRLMSVAVATNPVGPFWGYGSWGYGLDELAAAARDTAQHHLDEALEDVPDRLRPATVVLAGHVPTELAVEADKGVDLLCMGSRKHGPLSRVLLGSVSGGVVKDAPCPVLIVPRGHVETDEDAAPVGAASGAA